MTSLLFFLLGLGIIISGSWLFIFFPAGGLFTIVLGLMCLGAAGRRLDKHHKTKSREHQNQGSGGDDPATAQGRVNWGCLMPFLVAVALFIGLAIYNNRH